MKKKIEHIRNMRYPKEECGVFGIWGHPDAAKISYFGLFALQHRGQESAGIVTSDEKEVHAYKSMGLVSEVFTERRLNDLKGHISIGHVRYSTTGSSIIQNAQPFCVRHAGCTIAIAHNGNLVNSKTLKNELENQGSIFQTTMDSEVIVHLLARSWKLGLEEAIVNTMSFIKGSYSLVLLTEDKIIGIRDPYGVRPLCIGKLNDSYILTSETCALDLIQAEYVRDVNPGEVVIIDKNGLRSFTALKSPKCANCIFEFIYFARPDSKVFGKTVYNFRKGLGEQMAKDFPFQGDFVLPFPDSGNYAAVGFAQASKIPLELAVIRNHYVGRTFIQPGQYMREFAVRVKLNPVRDMIQGKRVVIVDDSIVRGTTSKNRINAIKAAGAKEIDMLVSCPPIKYPCYYGIDFPSENELIAHNKSEKDIEEYLGLDNLRYMSVESLLKVAGENSEHKFCLACFTGKYPIPVDEKMEKLSLEKI